MAHVKNHDYHILNPSLWPFIGAVAAFVMLFGAVLFFHGNGPWLLLIGLVGVLYVMFGWWADTVSENKDGDHTPVVLIGLRYGFILFIMSEVMFFAAWFWSFFKHAMYPMSDQSPIVDGVWPPVGIETFDPWHLPLINTLILLCSGAAATWAHHALVHENNRKDIKNGLITAILLPPNSTKTTSNSVLASSAPPASPPAAGAATATAAGAAALTPHLSSSSLTRSEISITDWLLSQSTTWSLVISDILIYLLS